MVVANFLVQQWAVVVTSLIQSRTNYFNFEQAGHVTRVVNKFLWLWYIKFTQILYGVWAAFLIHDCSPCQKVKKTAQTYKKFTEIFVSRMCLSLSVFLPVCLSACLNSLQFKFAVYCSCCERKVSKSGRISCLSLIFFFGFFLCLCLCCFCLFLLQTVELFLCLRFCVYVLFYSYSSASEKITKKADTSAENVKFDTNLALRLWKFLCDLPAKKSSKVFVYHIIKIQWDFI